MEKVFTVFVGSFNRVVRGDLSYSFEVDHVNASYINCIKDGDDMVNINTNERYYILKREENGTLAKSELSNIRFGEDYALSCREYKNEQKNVKEAFKVYLQAAKARCLINLEKKQLKKIK